MFVFDLLITAALAACAIYASPGADLDNRDLNPSQCSMVVSLVDALKLDQAGVVSSEQTKYAPDTSQGASFDGCCNFCFFGTSNCIQTYWYSYQGCVVERGTSVNGIGVGASNVCPRGQIAGLVYDPDNNPSFRSTGAMQDRASRSITICKWAWSPVAGTASCEP